MLEKDDLFELDDKLYVVFEELHYEGKDYCFCNEMINDKTFGKKFVIFQNDADGIILIDDKDLVSKILPMFQNSVNAEIYDQFQSKMGEE